MSARRKIRYVPLAGYTGRLGWIQRAQYLCRKIADFAGARQILSPDAQYVAAPSGSSVVVREAATLKVGPKLCSASQPSQQTQISKQLHSFELSQQPWAARPSVS